MQIRARALAAGMASYFPLVGKYVCGGTGGTVSARYCYSVWMRHLLKAEAAGHSLIGENRKLAEFGPGDSIGIGLAAMLSGYDKYFALDVKEHANIVRNVAIFQELLRLYSERAPIPGNDEFPMLSPELNTYSFPGHLLTDRVLRKSLDADRVAAIESAIRQPSRNISGNIEIAYVVPWTKTTLLDPDSIDVAFSQAVLEHVEDIASAYEAMYLWLRPGGLMSHAIDFQCHGLTRDWNGHWTLPDSTWKLVKGTRSYLINRLPYSAHRTLIESTGFQILTEVRSEAPPISRNLLSSRFESLSNQDLRTCGVFVQAVKLA